MARPDASLSLADLSTAGIRLRPVEAATIVRELASQVARGEIAGVPSAHVVRLSPAGSVFVEGPVAAGGREVARAAQLLDTLLPPFDSAPEFRAPGGLRLVIARALGTVDLPPYQTLESFVDALQRFAAPDPAPVVQHLACSWAETMGDAHAESAIAEDADLAEAEDAEELETAVQRREHDDATERVLESFAPAVPMPAETELTVSDVRRARRATGLTLAQVSERSHIPPTLLRELEWGLLQNWPSGHYGRIQLVRYARAAGLDEEVVVRAVWPLVDADAGRQVVPVTPAVSPVVALVRRVPHRDEDDDAAAAGELVAVPRAQPSRRSRVLATLAIPALLAVAVAPALLYRPANRSTAASPPASQLSALPSASAGPSASSGAPNTSGTETAVEPAVTVPPPQAAVRSEPDLLVPETAVPGARSTMGEIPAGHTAPAEGLSADATAYSPAFASVGSAMFYHAEADGRSALMRADTDSRGAVLRITRIVDDTSRNFHARPSPDGTRIAFDSDREGVRAVYVADADGKDVRRVTGEGFAAVPSWSPDGQSLAYVRAEPGKPRVWNLWVSDLATGASRRLTSHSYGQPWGGSWFPDGRRIAYSHEDRLIVLDLETRRQRVYPSPRKGRLVRTPAVSPDGRRVIFQVRRDGAWLLELKDGSMRKVLSDPTAEEYTWAPDGSRVAYHSRQSGSWGVWVMAPR